MRRLPAYRAVAGDLRLAYSQFEGLESFARFATRLDEAARNTIERGKRVREILQQPQFAPIPVPEQIAVLLAVTEGLLDSTPPSEVSELEGRLRGAIREQPAVDRRILEGRKLTREDRRSLVEALRRALQA